MIDLLIFIYQIDCHTTNQFIYYLTALCDVYYTVKGSYAANYSVCPV